MLNIVYWVRGREYADMAVISAESMKRVYKGARVYVYSDEDYAVFGGSAVDQVVMLPMQDSMPAMIANLYCQVHFCMSEAFLELPTLFADADVLAVQPAPIEDDGYDLLVTQRDHIGLDEKGKKVVGVARGMPYNYGVVIAAPTDEAREAFLWMRERLAKMGGHLQAWYGNQWALRELVGGSFQDETPRLEERRMPWALVKVRVENCEQWNYSPEDEYADLAEVYFVHLKGDKRKEMLEGYAERLAA